MSRLFLQIAQVLRFLQKTVGQFVHSRKHNWSSRLKYSISRFIFSASADMSCHNQNFQSKQYINIVSFSILRQHRTIWQEAPAWIFGSIQSLENEGILYVPARGYAASVSQLTLATAAQYFSFFKLKKWGIKTAAARRHNCAVLP